VNEDDVQASYNSGILEVRVPSAAQDSAPRRKVPVYRSDATGRPASHDGDAGQESMGTKVDPDFIPDGSRETPEQKRAREHPEETGS
jgi:hypothetical protein